MNRASRWAAVVLAAAIWDSLARAQTTERVSVATGGAQGNANRTAFQFCSISAGGRVGAFQSDADNFVAGETNGVQDVFLRDRRSGTTERVSVGTAGTQGNDNSGDIPALAPSISADGRFVAFQSAASNLVAGDTNGRLDIFVRDRRSGTTERVSVATDGTQGNDNSGDWGLSISADGRFVAFISSATNLVSGDTNANNDVFVHDRQSGTTERASVATDGTQANFYSRLPSISADGRFVAFLGNASNLVPGDTNGWADVFVLDRPTAPTEPTCPSTGG